MRNQPGWLGAVDTGVVRNCGTRVCASQVVVKTKADYDDAESKRGKLRSPKVAEFSISIIEGVSERLKVRTTWPPSPLPVTDDPAAPSMHILACLHVWAIGVAPDRLIHTTVAMAMASKQRRLSRPSPRRLTNAVRVE